VDRLPLLRRVMKLKLAERYEELFRSLEDNDLALEWCENQVIEAALPNRPADQIVKPEHYELFENFTTPEIAQVVSLLQRRTYQPNEVIIKAGDAGDEMFFLAKGRASVFAQTESGARKRLATFSPIMVFGEIAMLDNAPRTATIIADSEITCDVLNRANFEPLGATHPGIKIKLLENLSLCLCRRLRERKLSVLE
jgi:CRP-like cAMP-binding protein